MAAADAPLIMSVWPRKMEKAIYLMLAARSTMTNASAGTYCPFAVPGAELGWVSDPAVIGEARLF